MVANANNEDEAKRSGKQDGGALNPQKERFQTWLQVPSPEVEQIGPIWGISARRLEW